LAVPRWGADNHLISQLEGALTTLTRIGLTFALLLVALPARATSVTIGGTAVSGQGQFSSVAGATTVDFNALSLGDQNFVSGIATYQANIFSVPVGGGADLLDDTTRAARAQGSPLTIGFSQPIGYFGLYWGSPDPLDTIMFFSGATQVFAFSGVQLGLLGVGFGNNSAAYVNFSAGPGESYTRIELSDNVFPFETDNHAFSELVAVQAVPEPASLLLLGAGLLVVARQLRVKGKT
jgi:hypothetical protein